LDGTVGIPKHTRIILMTDDERPTREYGISRPVVILLLGLTLVMVGFLTLVLISYAAQIRQEHHYQGLRDELTAAHTQLEDLAELTGELERMRTFQERVLRILGVEPVAEATVAPGRPSGRRPDAGSVAGSRLCDAGVRPWQYRPRDYPTSRHRHCWSDGGAAGRRRGRTGLPHRFGRISGKLR
jgi:hypothetical protein